ncbi:MULTISPECIES: DUF6884 domain-containing protein [unclassified Archaeoglobus]|jgi:hypothetical protein|uniref:DUF6884 domain-containing protein n=1 Tax=unclassified Archaeoglobus TaxID=2643606 RepID=UPI0025BED4D1|nr:MULTISPECIES: DUF6884 domain-containing protein [unclassified Archaeoglobus]
MRTVYPIPFFVVDRPMSLELLKFCEINKLPFRIGLMGHANTSKNFQREFKNYKEKNIIKMVDSGVFSKDGCKHDYFSLFETYEKMDVEFGVIIDVLKNKDKTIKSANEAMRIYKDGDYRFKLVGVAQGNDVKEYLECYKELKKLGYEYIAIGGLLKKIENSSRYVRVRDENFLKNIVAKIRAKYPNDWLFLLGCFHPKRIELFRSYKIFGADYKGWILNYKPPTPEEKSTKSKEELRERRFIQVKKYLYTNVFSNYLEIKRKLLIIPCSKTKKNIKGELPAIDLYDGPFFKLLRKYANIPFLDVYIISAKYGLIEAFEPIKKYDLRMNSRRASELRASITKHLETIIKTNNYSDILINLGNDYLVVLDGWLEELVSNNRRINVICLKGKIGERLGQMKKWLDSLKSLEVSTSVDKKRV